MSLDVIVLGAGMVGVSSALHCQARGLEVALVDRRGAGEETSHGNAGVIERDSHVPITFPSKLADILKYARNREVAMRYDPFVMPKLAPWLFRLWRNSSAQRVDHYAQSVEPLRKKAMAEHRPFAEDAGIMDAFRDNGWIHLYQSDHGFKVGQLALSYAEEYGVEFDLLDRQQLLELEPSVTAAETAKAIYWKEAVSVSSPRRVVKAYADLFVGRGGAFVMGDALSLHREGDMWVINGKDGPIAAPCVIVALGPWSMDLLKPLGYDFPLAIKRGYHQHFTSKEGASLNRPVVDEETGFLITPMEDGVRLTTGVEFADRDAPKNIGQITAATKAAKALYPLDKAVEDEPWMGGRPCLPDSLPIVSPSGDRNGLYFNFGHGHLGFGCGPVTGRLIADFVTGGQPDLDPKPYSARRFV